MLGITIKDSLWGQQLSELTDVVMLLTTTKDSLCGVSSLVSTLYSHALKND
jgi:hypothetical protein